MLRLLPLLTLLLCACAAKGERARGPVPQQVYVWQRAWTPAVIDAVRSHGPAFERVVLLGAEVTFSGGVARAAWPDWTGTVLQGRGVGLAVRIGDDRHALEHGSQLSDIVWQTLERARAKGLSVAELQIDHDCPTSRLPAYRKWLLQLRSRVPGVVLTITALPAWLGAAEWPALAASVDGFVLQVHALTAPARPGQPIRLCDSAAALAAVERAAEAGQPFRVALPTYAYDAVFDINQRLLGVLAETPEPALPAERGRVRLAPQPAEIAGLVRGWQADRPAMLQGIIWFRLPVAGDVRNWAWPTLDAVRQGIEPKADVRVRAVTTGGLVELTAENRGDADGELPEVTTLRWQGASLVASDATLDLAVTSDADRAQFVNTTHHSATLPPGAHQALGWLRFDQPPHAIEVLP